MYISVFHKIKCPSKYRPWPVVLPPTLRAGHEFMLANLLYLFDWEVPDGVKIEDLNMQEEGTLVLRKKVPICLVPVPTKY
ncbi:hypothetical protein Hdeb2414_s0774g00945531 [Helianthus debilis subsp. tardiflorus]